MKEPLRVLGMAEHGCLDLHPFTLIAFENKILDDYGVVCPVNVPDVLSRSHGAEQLGCVSHNPK